jgi:hypothetical protein
MRRLLVVLLLLYGVARAQTTIFNCTSFNTTTATCGVHFTGQDQSLNFFAPQAGSVTGGVLDFVPTGSGHNGNSLWYQTAVNEQAFTASVTFVPSGYDNLAFVLQNENNNGNKFTVGFGAGPEGGFSQFSGGSNIYVTRVFAFELDQYSTLLNSGSFSYSSAQIYQTLQPPFTDGDYLGEGLAWYQTNKISTSPVPLNSPANSQSTTTGDTYTLMLSYDGWNFNACLYDVTAANGSCSSATSGTGTYFQHSWSGVLIPEIVAGTTSVVGLTNGVSATTTNPLLVSAFSYTVQTPTGTPSYTAYNANSTYNNGTVSAASPVYSVAPGTYSSAQSVAITTSSTPNNYICYVLSSTVPTLYPMPNNNGGCDAGTLYTGPVSISSTSTLYAIAGSNNSAFSYSISPTGLGPPSTLVAGTYTIASSAATPTFSPVAGTYTGTQSVTLSTSSSGAIICYNTTGSPATNGSTGCTTGTLYSSPVSVSSNETLYAVAGGTGYADSSVGSAAYTINTQAATPTFSPVAGTYTGSQTVTISTSTGSVICYNTTGSPAPNGSTGCTTGTLYTGPVSVSSSETLYAAAGGTGYTNSSVGSAAYTINPITVKSTLTGKTVLSGKAGIN